MATPSNTSNTKGQSAPTDRPYLYKDECLISDWLYLFAKKIIRVGQQKTFTNDDLFPVKESWRCENMLPEFERKYYQKLNEGKSFRYSVYYPFMKEFFIALFEFMFGTACGVLAPIAVKQFVSWLSSPKSNHPSTSAPGWIWGAVIVVSLTIKIIYKRRSMFVSFITQYRVGLCLRALIFKKLRSLSTEAIRNLDVGKFSNAISSDIMTIQLAIRFSNILFISPFLLLAITIYLFIEFGWVSLVIPVINILMFFFQIFVNKITTPMIAKKKIYADRRVKFISEVVTGIKNVKFQAWEDQVLKRIEDLRAQECALLKRYISLRLLAMQISDLNSSLCILFFFVFYTVVNGKNLTLAEAYMVISFISQLSAPSKIMNMAIDKMTASQISLERLEKVIRTPDHSSPADDLSLLPGQIVFHSYSAGWFSKPITDYFHTNQDKLHTLALRTLSFTFHPARFYAVLGEVGAGKTSLLLAALGDLAAKTGTVAKRGSVAYISQSPFLLNASIKDNILFFAEYDEERYKACLVKCCLLDDLRQLPGGDLTEIGERGINLSGGQKQRITIARALYADKEIYLVDDCLSALDAEVGRSIFHSVFRKALRGKTVVMVTHATFVLPEVDEVVLMKGGQIVASGSYSEVRESREYAEYHRHTASQTEEQSKTKPAEDKTEVAEQRGEDSEREAAKDIPEERPPSDSPAGQTDGSRVGGMSVEEVRLMGEMEEAEYRGQMEMLEELFVKISEEKKAEMARRGDLTKAEQSKKGMVKPKYFKVFFKSYSWCLYLS